MLSDLIKGGSPKKLMGKIKKLKKKDSKDGDEKEEKEEDDEPKSKGEGLGFANEVMGLVALVKRKRLEKEAIDKKAAMAANNNATEINS